MDEDIIVDFDLISTQEKEEIKKIIYDIPFYWTKRSTSEKFPYYSHILSERPLNEEKFSKDDKIVITSPYFKYFYSKIRKFCDKYNIKHSNVIRSCLNSTFYFSGYPYIDPHVDFSKENHLVVIIYLSDTNGETLIFNKTKNFLEHEEDLGISDFKNRFLKIRKKVRPELGKILCFPGKYYHSNKFPKPGENRLVCVFNLLT